jgi:polysaccharide export outer membrane protein
MRRLILHCASLNRAKSNAPHNELFIFVCKCGTKRPDYGLPATHWAYRMRILFSLLALFCIECAASPALAQSSSTQTNMQVAANAAPQASRTAISAYILGGGDQIRVVVFGEDNISGDYLVDAEGNITMPLIGRVAAAGATPDSVARTIATQLANGNFVQNARVTAGMISYRPFYVLGEVQRPGAYPYAPDMNALNAVATAGGYTYRANTRRLFIRRAGQLREQPVATGTLIQINPGDTLRVGERFF